MSTASLRDMSLPTAPDWHTVSLASQLCSPSQQRALAREVFPWLLKVPAKLKWVFRFEQFAGNVNRLSIHRSTTKTIRTELFLSTTFQLHPENTKSLFDSVTRTSRDHPSSPRYAFRKLFRDEKLKLKHFLRFRLLEKAASVIRSPLDHVPKWLSPEKSLMPISVHLTLPSRYDKSSLASFLPDSVFSTN